MSVTELTDILSPKNKKKGSWNLFFGEQGNSRIYGGIATMVIVSKYRLECNEKKIFLVISEEETICPECGNPLCRRDRKLRIHKEAGGKKSWFAINRLKCTNEKCRRLHNELPDCMIPYKHYGSDIIEDVVDEVIGADDPGTENYPCEATMKHWKWWVSRNEININGQMRSMLHHLMDFDIKFLKSGDSLLKELKGLISPGWLSVVTRFLYNSGGRIEPYPET